MTTHKKIVRKLIYGFTACLLCAVLSVILLLKFRLKETLQFIVDQETHGLYHLTVGEVNYGFNRQTVDLYDASLTLRAGRPNPVKKVTLKHLHFTIRSFTKLLVGELTIRSLFIENPEVTIQATPSKQKPIQQTLTRLYEGFCAFGAKLELEQIRAKGITARLELGKDTLVLTKLSASLSDFQVDHNNRAISGKLRLKTGKQRIKVGDNRLAFGAFTLDEKGKFTLKNVRYRQSERPRGGIESIETEQLQIKLKRDFFEQSSFEIDTLSIHQSDIVFRGLGNPNYIGGNEKTSQTLFDEIRVHHVVIDNAQLAFLNKQASRHVALARQNLRLDSLHIYPNRSFSIHKAIVLNDSIRYSSKNREIQVSFRSFSYQDQALTIYSPSVSLSKNWVRANRWQVSSIEVAKIRLDQLDVNDLFDRKFETENLTLWTPVIRIDHPLASKTASERPSIQQQFEHTRANISQVLTQIGGVYQTRNIRIIDAAFHLQRPNQRVSCTGLTTTVNYPKLMRKKQVKQLTDVLDRIDLKTVRIYQPNLSLSVDDLSINTKQQYIAFHSLSLSADRFTTSGTDGRLAFVDFSETDQFQLRLPKLALKRIEVHTKEPLTEQAGLMAFSLQLDTVLIDQAQLVVHGKQQPKMVTELAHLEWKNVQLTEQHARWDVLNGIIERIQVAEHPAWNIQVAKGKIYERGIHLNNIRLQSRKNTHNRIHIRDVDVQLPYSGIAWNQLHIQSLDIFKPDIQWHLSDQANRETISSEGLFPGLIVDRMYFERGTLDLSGKLGESQTFATAGKWEGEIRQLVWQPTSRMENPIDWIGEQLTGKGKLHYLGESFDYHNGNQHLRTGELLVTIPQFIPFEKILEWKKNSLSASHSIDLSTERVTWENTDRLARVRFVKWSASAKQLLLRETQYSPKKNVYQWLDDQSYQRTYLRLDQGSFVVKNLDLTQLNTQRKLPISALSLTQGAVYLAKDRTQPFQSGIEKPMLTEWIQQHDFPFEIDTVTVYESQLLYEEKSAITNRWSSVFLEQINGQFANFRVHPRPNDSLQINVSFNLNRIPMEAFHYSEAYTDPNHGYRLHVMGKSLDLKQLSPLTKSILSLEILSGNAAHFEANIIGNRDFSVGKMDFFYDKLQLKKLNDHDTLQRSFLLGVVNFAANSFVLKQKNSDRTYIFHQRDKERWIINAWMKATLNGIFSSTGIISRRKAYRKYLEKRQLLLPANSTHQTS